MNALLVKDEALRIEALQQYEVLSTASDPVLDDITRLAAQLCGTPIAAISLIDSDRICIKARTGIDVTEVALGSLPCETTILGDTELTDPPQGRALTLTRPGGSIYMVDLGGGRWRIAPIDHATLADPVSKPVTFSDLRASTLRLAGTDFGMRETPDTWLSRVGDEARHAASSGFDATLLAKVPFEFAGTGTVDGLSVDKFVEHVDHRRFGQQTLPGSLVGEPGQATVTLPESLTATNTFWVDPLTGATVDVTMNQTVELQGATPAERLVLLGGTMSETAASVQSAVDNSQQQHSKITLIQITIPLIGILLGIIALAIGITLVLRSPEPWVPAYDDDEVEDMAR